MWPSHRIMEGAPVVKDMEAVQHLKQGSHRSRLAITDRRDLLEEAHTQPMHLLLLRTDHLGLISSILRALHSAHTHNPHSQDRPMRVPHSAAASIPVSSRAAARTFLRAP